MGGGGGGVSQLTHEHQCTTQLREMNSSLTDGGDVRRVELVVRESAQQACFPDPRIPEEQESEEDIVLFSHGAVDVEF